MVVLSKEWKKPGKDTCHREWMHISWLNDLHILAQTVQTRLFINICGQWWWKHYDGMRIQNWVRIYLKKIMFLCQKQRELNALEKSRSYIMFLSENVDQGQRQGQSWFLIDCINRDEELKAFMSRSVAQEEEEEIEEDGVFMLFPFSKVSVWTQRI